MGEVDKMTRLSEVAYLEKLRKALATPCGVKVHMNTVNFAQID